MIAKGAKKGQTKFVLKPADGTKQVSLAAGFTEWKATPMKKQKDGSFALTVAVPPGTHEYKFVVDGQWVVDPDNNKWALNPYGTLNSVAQVS
jgi:1,4-alpha-glucan branching enzyme